MEVLNIVYPETLTVAQVKKSWSVKVGMKKTNSLQKRRWKTGCMWLVTPRMKEKKFKMLKNKLLILCFNKLIVFEFLPKS